MCRDLSVNSYYGLGRRQVGIYRFLYVGSVGEYMDSKKVQDNIKVAHR